MTKTAQNRFWNSNHPEKHAAHKIVYIAVRRGDLPKVSTMPCLDCGKSAAHYHHADYSAPLSVEPLCIRCHTARHSAMAVSAILGA